MTDMLAQLPDPHNYASIGWIVVIVGGLMITLLTCGYYAVSILETVQRIRRGKAARDVNVVNKSQRRDVALVPTFMTKTMCDERHGQLSLGNENLIRLRTMEQIAAYEAQAKQSREKLHNQIGELKTDMASLKTSVAGLEKWTGEIDKTLQNVSAGLANLAGQQASGE